MAGYLGASLEVLDVGLRYLLHGCIGPLKREQEVPHREWYGEAFLLNATLYHSRRVTEEPCRRPDRISSLR